MEELQQLKEKLVMLVEKFTQTTEHIRMLQGQLAEAQHKNAQLVEQVQLLESKRVETIQIMQQKEAEQTEALKNRVDDMISTIDQLINGN